MKKKLFTKIFGALSVCTIAPLVTASITSCSKSYSTLTKAVVEHLVQMNKHARCTDQNYSSSPALKMIRSYISAEAYKAGIAREDITIDTYGNMWFDVPATEGCENWKPLALQAHMDMVVAGMTKEEKFVKPIETEVDWKRGIVHSKNYDTTLGADDGAGVSIMLSLIQDTSIKHGPLRLIFTANEDSGMIGAEWIANDSHLETGLLRKMGKNFDGTPIEYILNIDGENDGQIVDSCSGSITYGFDCEFDVAAESALTNQCFIDIDGLKGGHSGDGVPNKHASAEKLSFEILAELTKTKNVQIIKNYHPDKDGDDIQFSRNQIVSHSRLLFYSDATVSDIQSAINSKMDSFKSTYPAEDWNNVKITCGLDTTPSQTKFISSSESKTIIGKLGNNTKPTGSNEAECIWYGVTEIPSKGIVSANIAPLNIFFKDNKMKVELSSQIRTKTNAGLSSMKTFYSNFQFKGAKTARSEYPAWEREQNNKLVDVVKASYITHGATPKVEYMSGGVETTFWVKCNPNIHATCIGPQIDGAHTKKETLHIDTIQTVLDVVIDTFKAMNQ